MTILDFAACVALAACTYFTLCSLVFLWASLRELWKLCDAQLRKEWDTPGLDEWFMTFVLNAFAVFLTGTLLVGDYKLFLYLKAL